jgi:hypothetical protein
MTGHSEVTRSISEQGALFRINVENRDYHYLSQSEIAGAKRISRHLFGSVALEAQVLTVIAAVLTNRIISSAGTRRRALLRERPTEI